VVVTGEEKTTNGDVKEDEEDNNVPVYM